MMTNMSVCIEICPKFTIFRRKSKLCLSFGRRNEGDFAVLTLSASPLISLIEHDAIHSLGEKLVNGVKGTIGFPEYDPMKELMQHGLSGWH